MRERVRAAIIIAACHHACQLLTSLSFHANAEHSSALLLMQANDESRRSDDCQPYVLQS